MSNLHYERVFKSPINTSISKNLFSIPKSERFEKTRRSEYSFTYLRCTRSFYEIKSNFDKARTTSFGFGNRTDMANY